MLSTISGGVNTLSARVFIIMEIAQKTIAMIGNIVTSNFVLYDFTFISFPFLCGFAAYLCEKFAGSSSAYADKLAIIRIIYHINIPQSK